MSRPRPPLASVPMVSRGGLPTQQWYDFLRALAQSDTLGDYADDAAAAAAGVPLYALYRTGSAVKVRMT